MDQLERLYPAHLERLQQRTGEVLQLLGAEALLIHSGSPLSQFLDDQSYPFKVNPHFKAWLPVVDSPDCWLLVDGQHPPRLLFYRSQDFWHKPAELPAGGWTSLFDITLTSTTETLHQWLPARRRGLVLLAEQAQWGTALDIASQNPQMLLDFLHYHRAAKSDYELVCMRLANQRAIAGHQAAREAFFAGASELEIHLAHLAACGHAEHELPYPNIVAFNEHAAILHYTQLQRAMHPDFRRVSLLIDAGAQYRGYAADITRTYAFEEGEFGQLIAAVDQAQQQLISQMRCGQSFVDLHLEMHRLLAGVLVEQQLVTGSAEAALEQGISRVFFPHGLGHQLGLQVHDVGGQLLDERGKRRPPPVEHPFLRCTRLLSPGQVVTVEPGLYFIDSLLAALRQQPAGRVVNWPRVDRLRQCGGIRIEDNVIVHPDHIENITRDQGLELLA